MSIEGGSKVEGLQRTNHVNLGRWGLGLRGFSRLRTLGGTSMTTSTRLRVGPEPQKNSKTYPKMDDDSGPETSRQGFDVGGPSVGLKGGGWKGEPPLSKMSLQCVGSLPRRAKVAVDPGWAGTKYWGHKIVVSKHLRPKYPHPHSRRPGPLLESLTYTY